MIAGCKETEKNGTSFQAADEACAAANPSLRNGGSNSRSNSIFPFSAVVVARNVRFPPPSSIFRCGTPKEFCRDDRGSSPPGLFRFGAGGLPYVTG